MRGSPALVVITALSCGALAQDDLRIEPDSGRLLANWPPPTPFDHLHMRLELDIPSMDEPFARAVETLRITARGSTRDQLVLDAGEALTITGVSVRGRPASFVHADGSLSIALRPPVLAGQTVDVEVRFDLTYRNASGAGLTWTPGKPDADNLTAQSAQIHSQGQPESNHTWFPCHDFPNERLTTQLVVTVDSSYQVCANGRLVSQTERSDGRTTWDWLQDKSHPAYLVLLVIGRFDIVPLGGPDSARPGLPMNVYAPVGQGAIAAEVCALTPEMVAYFERRFDEPYPWDKYDQLFVRNFAAGGMENTSATTLTPSVLVGGRPEIATDLIAHELAHQWFGDMVGYSSWEHLWLGEGWASYAEALWEEHTGDEEGQMAYQRTMLRYMRQQRGASARSESPATIPMVSNRYPNPDVAFFKPENVYSRGACVLHMLRARLGTEVFFRGVADYLDRYRLEQADTDDFRRCLEAASGHDLERFFDQWLLRPGLPKLRFELEWDESAGELVVTGQQVQTIDVHNPAYALSLPLLVKFPDDAEPARTLRFDIDGRDATARFPLPVRPVDVVCDPAATYLTDSKVTKPLAMWIEQLRNPPSLFAQVEAAEALASSADPAAAAALAALDPSTDEAVLDIARRAAIAAR